MSEEKPKEAPICDETEEEKKEKKQVEVINIDRE
jgi:hypothetical protein